MVTPSICGGKFSVSTLSTFIVALCASVAPVASAATNVGGPIFANTTWNLAGSPYIVTNSIIVGSNATLTIQPGVVVQVNNGLGIQIGSPEGFGNGTLVAIGTPAQPIRFTTSDPAPAPGKWNNILFTDLAIDAVYNGGGVYQSGSVLQNVIVEYAGNGAAASGAVMVVNASPSLNAVEVRQSARSGIRIDSALAPSLRIANCHLHNNAAGSGQSGGGLYVLNGLGHIITGNNIHNNSASSGGGVYLQSVGGVTFANNTLASNNASSGGGLYATSAATLVLQSNLFTTNTTSNYGGFYLDGASVQVLSNTISDNDSSNYCGFYCASSNSTITNNVISGNTGNGTYGGSYLSGNSQMISGNEWTGNSASSRGGVHVDGSSVTFTDNEITDNQATGVNSDVGGLEVGGSGMTVSNNLVQGNSSQRNAGGIHISGSGHSLVDNTIDDNFAGHTGGGVYIEATNTTWTRNTITENEANVRGGGFYNDGTGTNLAGNSVTNIFNTIIGNIAPSGSAIYHDVANGATGNLQAQFVCWGTNNQGDVQGWLWDFFDNSALGIVITNPVVQDCGAGVPCPGDLDGDSSVGASDLAVGLVGIG